MVRKSSRGRGLQQTTLIAPPCVLSVLTDIVLREVLEIFYHFLVIHISQLVFGLKTDVHTHWSEWSHGSDNVAIDTLRAMSASMRHADNRASNIISRWPGVGLRAEIFTYFPLQDLAVDSIPVDEVLVQTVTSTTAWPRWFSFSARVPPGITVISSSAVSSIAIPSVLPVLVTVTSVGHGR